VPTEAPATEVPPTAAPVEPVPTELAPAAEPLAQVDLVPAVSELRAGERLTVTVTVANTGETPFGDLRCQLLGQWQPVLKEASPTVVVLPEPVDPGAIQTVTFVLEAVQVGTASLQAAITMETPGQSPRPGGAVSGSASISVVQ
jgi:hypothetical protein